MICPLPGDISGAATLAHREEVLLSVGLYVHIDGSSENIICPLPGHIPGAATLAHREEVLLSVGLYT